MNKEELRIGNMVQVDYDYYIINSISATLCECLTMENNDPHQVHIGNIDPIPLSAAILEKAGFVDDGNVKQSVYVYKDKNLSFSIAESQLEDNEMYISCDNAFSGINTVTGVKYLHQLQNIVASITGQELQITL